MQAPQRHQTPLPWPQLGQNTAGLLGQGGLGPPAGREPAWREGSAPQASTLLFPPEMSKCSLTAQRPGSGAGSAASASGMRETEETEKLLTLRQAPPDTLGL